MLFLHILQNADGSFAWLNLIILVVLFGAGYLLSNMRSRKTTTRLSASSHDWEKKFKQTENEYKSYKSGHEATFKQHDKALAEMTGRVKALEGDIKVLSEEKNKVHHALQEKEEGLKNYARQISNLEDQFKQMREENEKHVAELSGKLKSTREDLGRALSWENKVHAAEEDARKSKAAYEQLQRRSLEFDLRLKTASEYAAKVQPLEAEIKSWQERYALLEQQLADNNQSGSTLTNQLNKATAETSSLQTVIIELKKQLGEKDVAYAALQKQWQLAVAAAESIQALQSDITTLKLTNQQLQKELAEKSAVLSSMKLSESSVTIAPAIVTAGAAATALLTEDKPGEGEES